MFIQDIKEGDKVHYHPVKGEPHDGKVYTVKCLSVLGHGEAVAFLNERTGCVGLTFLSPVEDEE